MSAILGAYQRNNGWEKIMGQNKEDWIGATGGMFASAGERQARLRIRALADKAKIEELSADENAELRRLADSVSDNAEFEE